MKRLLAIILLIVTCCTIFACGKKEESQLPYRLVQENGNWYIYFDDVQHQNLSGQIMVESVYFEDPAEMERKIFSGDFTEDELRRMKVWYVGHNSPILIPDFQDFPALICPDDYYRIRLNWVGGSTWSYEVIYSSTEKEHTARVQTMDSHYAQKTIEEMLAHGGVSASEIVMTEKDSTRNATIFYYDRQNEYLSNKHIVYTFEKDGSIFYIREVYHEGNTLPSSIKVISEQSEDMYVIVTIVDPYELCSAEWLSSFALIGDN